MVMWTRNNGRFVSREWHEFRENARRTAFNVETFAQSDIIEYDLEGAGITGKDNPRTYIWDRSIDILDVNGYDVRDGDTK